MLIFLYWVPPQRFINVFILQHPAYLTLIFLPVHNCCRAARPIMISVCCSRKSLVLANSSPNGFLFVQCLSRSMKDVTMCTTLPRNSLFLHPLLVVYSHSTRYPWWYWSRVVYLWQIQTWGRALVFILFSRILLRLYNFLHNYHFVGWRELPHALTLLVSLSSWNWYHQRNYHVFSYRDRYQISVSFHIQC